MECTKCHSIIDDNLSVCPKCNKVLYLECPNCHSLEESAVCQKCGYTILVKCSKCSKLVPTEKELCPKCSFPTKTSLAMQECELDEFAALIIKFDGLKRIKKVLKSKEKYSKFTYKLKNLLYAQLSANEYKLVVYDDVFVVNMNKELSFSTSSNKAIRLGLKILNAFVNLNKNVIENFQIPLGLNITIIKKQAEELLRQNIYKNNIKPVLINTAEKKYLRGLELVVDQYVCDEINKDYKTDSLYVVENEGSSIIFYKLILDSYVLPPTEDEYNADIKSSSMKIEKAQEKKEKKEKVFKVLDINAKCSFLRIPSSELFYKLSTIDLKKEGKLIALRADENYSISSLSLEKTFEERGYKAYTIACNEEMYFKPWSFFIALFKAHFKIYDESSLRNIDQASLTRHKPLFELILGKPIKAMTPEDARFAYMEAWGEFLATLKEVVVVIDGYEYIDDTSLQTLEIYFDNYKKIVPNFVFLTPQEVSVHVKNKDLLRTNLYTEIVLEESSLDSCLDLVKSDATDFIQSFYYEKINECFNGSCMYFKNAVEYLKESGVLIDFDSKLLIKNKKSVILPKSLRGLLKARIKQLSKNQDISFIFAYFALLGNCLSIDTLKALGVEDIDKHITTLVNSEFITVEKDCIKLHNYNVLMQIIKESLKKEAELFLVKNIVAKLGKKIEDYKLAIFMGILEKYKEEYLILWKNSQFAIKTGDYDSYLKNSLGFLSLVGLIDSNISKEDIENNKKEVFNNILLYLYNYSPKKVYFIEKLLLIDAINENDEKQIVKLSNMMLQGALLSSNYTEALDLLHNILSKMPEPDLVIDGAVNAKFFLLSLINIEILYNIGDYKQCVDLANKILSVITPEILEKIKPASFSTNLFVNHIQETLNLAVMAKIYMLDSDIDEFLESINKALNFDLKEKDSILAFKKFISGEDYALGNIDEYSAYSKLLFLILQEFSILENDYKRFAQNIHQAKLLAQDINQIEMEYFCDLMIAYSYFKLGVVDKAKAIYNDIEQKAEQSAMFGILLVVKYLVAILKYTTNEQEEALMIVNDSLAIIRRFNNQAKILYIMFEKLFIKYAEELEIAGVDIDSENLKISEYADLVKIF